MIELKNLCKSFKTEEGELEVLKNISLTVPDGEIYGIIGMSGAGKSTLVRCINMLEKPTSGSVIIDGKDMGGLSEKELREERRNIAMIFQNFNLLMQKTCLKNVCFPLELSGVKKSEAKSRGEELLKTVGLEEKMNAYPAQLSGGQQQRVAIARALATHPKVLLCDEATSALDPQTTNSILSLIRDINKKLGITVIMITHQMNVIEEICGKVAILSEGAVAEEGDVGTVFSSPKSEAAKRLVFPEGYTDIGECGSVGQRVRVVFNGADATTTPLIAQMAIEKGISANILSAATRTIGGRTYGNMLLGIPGDRERLEQAVAYLKEAADIAVEEVN